MIIFVTVIILPLVLTFVAFFSIGHTIAKEEQMIVQMEQQNEEGLQLGLNLSGLISKRLMIDMIVAMVIIL